MYCCYVWLWWVKLERAFTFWKTGTITIKILQTAKLENKAPVYNYNKLTSGSSSCSKDQTKESSKLAAFDNTNWGAAARNYLHSFMGFSSESLKDIKCRAKAKSKVIRGSRGNDSDVGQVQQVDHDNFRSQLMDACKLASQFESLATNQILTKGCSPTSEAPGHLNSTLGA